MSPETIITQLEQRNAELVEQLKAYGKYAHDTTLADRNAELVAALAKSNKDNATLAVQAVRAEQVLRHVAKWTNDGEILERCNKVLALARAESATPEGGDK